MPKTKSSKIRSLRGDTLGCRRCLTRARHGRYSLCYQCLLPMWIKAGRKGAAVSVRMRRMRGQIAPLDPAYRHGGLAGLLGEVLAGGTGEWPPKKEPHG